MKTAKAVALVLLSLASYLIVTTGLSHLYCSIFNVDFDFLASVNIWLLIDAGFLLVVSAVMCVKGKGG